MPATPARSAYGCRCSSARPDASRCTTTRSARTPAWAGSTSTRSPARRVPSARSGSGPIPTSTPRGRPWRLPLGWSCRWWCCGCWRGSRCRRSRGPTCRRSRGPTCPASPGPTCRRSRGPTCRASRGRTWGGRGSRCRTSRSGSGTPRSSSAPWCWRSSWPAARYAAGASRTSEEGAGLSLDTLVPRYSTTVGRSHVVRPSRSCSPSGQTARTTPAAASALRQPGHGGSVM